MTTAAKQPSTMRQLGALLGLLWSGRPRFGRRSMVNVVAASDIGMVRGNNEDYFLVADLGRPAMTSHGNDALGNLISEQPVLIVADGMGGAAGGEMASGLAATVIWSHLAQAARDRGLRTAVSLRRALAAAFRAANERIRTCAEAAPELAGMGTTATSAVFLRDELHVGHVGDSRLYLVRDGRAQRLTKDHSVRQYLIDTGAVSEADAPDERSHALLRALGPQPDVVVEISRTRLRHGDVVVLCSDGVWSSLADHEIAEVVRRRPEPRAACETFLRLASERGGRDNATAVVAQFDATT